jgi:hypothetical protein
MVNSKQKGKRAERQAAEALRITEAALRRSEGA